MPYLTVQQVADRLQVAPQTVGNWIAGGYKDNDGNWREVRKLKAKRAGRFWRITEEDLRAFVDQQATSE